MLDDVLSHIGPVVSFFLEVESEINLTVSVLTALQEDAKDTVPSILMANTFRTDFQMDTNLAFDRIAPLPKNPARAHNGMYNSQDAASLQLQEIQGNPIHHLRDLAAYHLHNLPAIFDCEAQHRQAIDMWIPTPDDIDKYEDLRESVPNPPQFEQAHSLPPVIPDVSQYYYFGPHSVCFLRVITTPLPMTPVCALYLTAIVATRRDEVRSGLKVR
ncbi:hypothetical protein BCR39DRAFT_557458 [Naematelia encephala]|uniref:Uncharacterized protein n=1 Tax=Naematelia encephala TaxID=71784 RepID=A0A1Y2BDP7_9TREE|nr:hypothetical protein BCR39DRAFT_557458 [Naematelia encephala]